MIPRSPGRRWTTLAVALAFIGITCADVFAQTPTLRLDVANSDATVPPAESDYDTNTNIGFYLTTSGGANSDMWVRLMVGVALRSEDDFSVAPALDSFGVNISQLYENIAAADIDWIPTLIPGTNNTSVYRTAIDAQFPGITGPFMHSLQASEIDYVVDGTERTFPLTYSLIDASKLASHVFNSCSNGSSYSTTAVTALNAYVGANSGDWWYAVPSGQSFTSTNWKSWNKSLVTPWTTATPPIPDHHNGRWFDTSRLREMAIEALAPSTQAAKNFINSSLCTDAVFSTALVLTVQAVGIYHIDANGLTNEGIPHITNSPTAPNDVRVLLSKMNIIDFKARKAEFAAGDGGGSTKGTVASGVSPRPKARQASSQLTNHGVTVRTGTGLSAELHKPLYPMRIAYSLSPNATPTMTPLIYDSVGIARLENDLIGLTQGTTVYIWGLWSEGYREPQPEFESYDFVVTVQ